MTALGESVLTRVHPQQNGTSLYKNWNKTSNYPKLKSSFFIQRDRARKNLTDIKSSKLKAN